MPHPPEPSSRPEAMRDIVDRLARTPPPGGPDHHVTIAAGHPPPAPASFDDIGLAHGMDGDGAALCEPGTRLAQVDDLAWEDVPVPQRCPVCTLILMA